MRRFLGDERNDAVVDKTLSSSTTSPWPSQRPSERAEDLIESLDEAKELTCNFYLLLQLLKLQSF